MTTNKEARDLAWLTYSDACARDGVPRNERAHLLFNAGWAAAYSSIMPPASPDHLAEAETHGMLPGSHERGGGAKCRCGMPWDYWNSRCLSFPADHQAEAPNADAVEDLAYLITAHRFRERGLRGRIEEPDLAVARPLAEFLIGEGYAARPVVDDAG